MPEKTHAFPDTNYFLHWPAFDKTDWKAVLGAEAVEVVVASVVFYEVEKHKDKNPKAAVRKRALQTTTTLEALGAERRAGAALAEGVMVRVLFDSAPPEGYASEVLAKEVADDRIVAAMLKMREAHPEDRIVVVTGDRALRMKARAHDFEAVEPPPEQRVRDDAEDTEVAELRRLLDLERSRRPSPWVEFKEGGSRLERTNRGAALSEDEFVAERMSALRESCPKRKPSGTPFSRSMPGESNEEIARYNGRLDAYYGQAETYLREGYRRALRLHRMPRIGFRLANAGNAAATNVRVVLGLGPGLRFWNPDEYPAEGAPPRTPSPPTTVALPSHLAATPRDEFERPSPRDPASERFHVAADSMSAWYEAPILVHNAPRELPTLLVEAENEDGAPSFSIAWTLSCAELLEPVVSRLNVTTAPEVDMEGAAAFQERLLRRYVTQFEVMKRANPERWEA